MFSSTIFLILFYSPEVVSQRSLKKDSSLFLKIIFTKLGEKYKPNNLLVVTLVTLSRYILGQEENIA